MFVRFSETTVMRLYKNLNRIQLQFVGHIGLCGRILHISASKSESDLNDRSSGRFSSQLLHCTVAHAVHCPKQLLLHLYHQQRWYCVCLYLATGWALIEQKV